MRTQLLDFLHHHRIPQSLSTKIIDFATRRRERELVDDQQFIKELPDTLRMELKEQLYKGLIETVPFFQDTGKNFRIKVVEQLEAKYIAQGERVIELGDPCTSIKLLAEGRCEILCRDLSNESLSSSAARQQTTKQHSNTLVRSNSATFDGLVHLGHIKHGCYFNAYSCLMQQKCPATVIAETFTHVYHLPYDKLDQLYSRYPEELERFKRRVTRT